MVFACFGEILAQTSERKETEGAVLANQCAVFVAAVLVAPPSLQPWLVPPLTPLHLM
jgi:hypothetical protein